MHVGCSAVGCPCAHIYSMARSRLPYLIVTCSRTIFFYLQRPLFSLILVVYFAEGDGLLCDCHG